MKKICIFSGFALPHLGGVERYTDKIVEELKRLGYEITIVTSNHDNREKYESLQNYEIYRLPTYSLFKNRYPLLKRNKEYRKIIKKIRNIHFDAYICQTRFYSTSQLGAKIANDKNKLPIIIEHGSNHLSVGNKFLDFFGSIYEHLLTNKLKKYNPKFYGVSKKCTEWLEHFHINATGIFYNSVSGDEYEKYYKKSAKKEIVISYAGRIIKEKGIYLLLNSFSNLEKEYNNIKLEIAGDGPILSELKRKYKSKNIKFLGNLNHEEVMELYNRTDIFAHPSMYPEGLPTSILEAGLMKCAIVATNRGGTKEVINEKKYGIIIEENEESLTEALTLLINNTELLNELKENIHNRINRKFTWEQTASLVSKELQKIK